MSRPRAHGKLGFGLRSRLARGTTPPDVRIDVVLYFNDPTGEGKPAFLALTEGEIKQLSLNDAVRFIDVPTAAKAL